MGTPSGLALALLILAVLSCEEPGPNNRPSNQSPPNTTSAPPVTGDGPISESADLAPSGKYWKGRSAQEGYDDERRRRQGGIGPCGHLADTCIRLHEDWQTGRGTQQAFLYAEQQYYACCNQYYPGHCLR